MFDCALGFLWGNILQGKVVRVIPDVRICVVGDSLVTGRDETAEDWRLQRMMHKRRKRSRPTTSYGSSSLARERVEVF